MINKVFTAFVGAVSASGLQYVTAEMGKSVVLENGGTHASVTSIKKKSDAVCRKNLAVLHHS